MAILKICFIFFNTFSVSLELRKQD